MLFLEHSWTEEPLLQVNVARRGLFTRNVDKPYHSIVFVVRPNLLVLTGSCMKLLWKLQGLRQPKDSVRQSQEIVAEYLANIYDLSVSTWFYVGCSIVSHRHTCSKTISTIRTCKAMHPTLRWCPMQSTWNTCLGDVFESGVRLQIVWLSWQSFFEQSWLFPNAAAVSDGRRCSRIGPRDQWRSLEIHNSIAPWPGRSGQRFLGCEPHRLKGDYVPLQPRWHKLWEVKKKKRLTRWRYPVIWWCLWQRFVQFQAERQNFKDISHWTSGCLRDPEPRHILSSCRVCVQGWVVMIWRCDCLFRTVKFPPDYHKMYIFYYIHV